MISLVPAGIEVKYCEAYRTAILEGRILFDRGRVELDPPSIVANNLRHN